MSKIKINFSQVRACEDELKDIFDIIEKDIESLDNLKNNRHIKSYGFDLLYSNLEKKISDLKDIGSSIGVLKETLSDIRQRYNLYEDKVFEELSVSESTSGSSFVVENQKSNSAAPQNSSNGWKTTSGHLEGKFGLNGTKIKLFSAEKVLDADGEVYNETSDIRDEFSFEAKILEGSASLAHSENEWKNKYGEVSANVDAFKVTGEAGVKAQWTKNGELYPFVGATLGAGVSVASGEVKGKLGNDDFNINGKAKAEVTAGEAKASVGVGRLDNSSKYGIKGDFKAEAYVARGEVKGGIDIFGIKVDATVGGKVVAAGIGGEFEVSNTGARVKASASALFGVDAEIGVDFSGLFNNIGKFFGK